MQSPRSHSSGRGNPLYNQKMSESSTLLDTLFTSIDRIKVDQCEVTDPKLVKRRFRLVQDLIARMPHKYLLAATKEQIQAAGRTMMLEGRTKTEMKTLQATLVPLLDLLWQVGTLPRHPLRPNEIRRSLNVAPPEAALAVSMPPEQGALIRSLLEPSRIDVHVVGSVDAALDRAGWFPFSFVLVRFPIAAPAEFFKALRSNSSLCRTAGVVILAKDNKIESARIFQGRGANRVLSFSKVNDQLETTLSDLAMVSERTRLRIPVVAEYEGRKKNWQSENISISGMLVQSKSDLKTGVDVDLEFTLPSSECSIRVAAEVVRKTTFGREDFDGLGLRFLSFVGEGQHHVELFLHRGN